MCRFLLRGAAVVNVAGAAAATPNGTPSSSCSVPALNGHVRATVVGCELTLTAVMDPETAKAIAEIGANATKAGAIVGFIGGLAGALLTQIGQHLLASRTLRHQRVLASDDARRKIRTERLETFMGVATKRAGLYTDWLNSRLQTGSDGGSRVHQADLWRDAGVLAILYEPFNVALEEFWAADQAIDELLARAEGVLAPEVRDEIDRRIATLRSATARLQRAADQYVLERVSD
jgi:hypothetical protein